MSTPDVKTRILHRLGARADLGVWTPVDFLDVGKRDAVDKVLQRLSDAQKIQRIDRGLYFKPRLNRLTGKPTNPDYRKIVDALARRDQTRMLIDGLTAANDLGLTDAGPCPRRHPYGRPPEAAPSGQDGSPFQAGRSKQTLLGGAAGHESRAGPALAAGHPAAE